MVMVKLILTRTCEPYSIVQNMNIPGRRAEATPTFTFRVNWTKNLSFMEVLQTDITHNKAAINLLIKTN